MANTIPVSTVVQVSISTAPTFPSRAGFGTLNIVGTASIIPLSERARIYNNIEGVSADFASTTEEHKAATTYFAQSPKPQQLVVSRRGIVPLAATLTGAVDPLAVIATWAAITDGSFSVTIDGVTQEVTAMDFNAATTLDAVAAVIQTAVQAANVAAGFATATFTYTDGVFVLTSGTTGVASSVTALSNAAAGTAIAANLKMEVGVGIVVAGVLEEPIADALTAIQDANQDWYGLALTVEARDQVDLVTATADWTESRIKVFGNDTQNGDVLKATVTTDVASVLKGKNLRRTMTCYNGTAGEYLAVSMLARAFTVNFNAPNSTITLKFKQAPSITTANLKQGEKIALDGKNANALYDVGGNVMFGEGFMANGIFFDEVHGLDWLQNAIETNVFGRLYTDTTKTAMTDSGVTSLQMQVEAGLEQGRENGLLAAGFDRDDNFLAKGYETSAVAVRNHNQSDKEARKGPPISFVALGAGAIHGIRIEGNFQR